MTPRAWLAANRVVVILAAIIVAALIALAFAAYTGWQARQTANTRVDLSRNQAGAALESGRDATNTVGNRAAVDAAGDQITRENADAIGRAEGANAVVAAPVRDAGRAALCRRAVYRDATQCRTQP